VVRCQLQPTTALPPASAGGATLLKNPLSRLAHNDTHPDHQLKLVAKGNKFSEPPVGQNSALKVTEMGLVL
jgi:hypothetical protein